MIGSSEHTYRLTVNHKLWLFHIVLLESTCCQWPYPVYGTKSNVLEQVVSKHIHQSCITNSAWLARKERCVMHTEFDLSALLVYDFAAGINQTNEQWTCLVDAIAARVPDFDLWSQVLLILLKSFLFVDLDVVVLCLQLSTSFRTGLYWNNAALKFRMLFLTNANGALLVLDICAFRFNVRNNYHYTKANALCVVLNSCRLFFLKVTRFTVDKPEFHFVVGLYQ